MSYYGTFSGHLRYTSSPHENLFSMQQAESVGDVIRMGGPPWKERDRYIRNSPITYVDQVQTPVLIVQGDLDYVPMQQGEEFFSSLYRQGKRAEFVRYWGEWHGIANPANLQDMWARILSWLDEFGDISRDADGNLVFNGERVRSRKGLSHWPPEAFRKLEKRLRQKYDSDLEDAF